MTSTNAPVSGLEATTLRVARSVGLATTVSGMIVLARLYAISALDAQTASEIANHANFGSLLLMLFISALPTLISILCAIALILICERVRAGRKIGLSMGISTGICAISLLVLVPFAPSAYLGPTLAMACLILTVAVRRSRGTAVAYLWSPARAITLVVILGISLNLILIGDRPMGQGVVVQTRASSKEKGLDGSVVGYVLNSNDSSLTLLAYRPRQVLLLDTREVVDISACKGSRSARPLTPAEWALKQLGVSRAVGGDNPPCFPVDMP